MEPFNLKGKEDIKKFECLMVKYGDILPHGIVSHFSIEKAYGFFDGREDRGKLVAALLDIKINAVLLHQDMISIGKDFNTLLEQPDDSPQTLDSENVFISRLILHRDCSNYVMRYRALWDKIMGFLVLMVVPQEHERFNKSKSKKKSFRKIMSATKAPPGEFINSIERALQDFDDKYRTAEVHGAGTLRKWTLLRDGGGINVHSELLGYWNLLNGMLHLIGQLIDPKLNQ